jgi:hypothetical protein
MKTLSAKASDQKLKDMLDESATGIGVHGGAQVDARGDRRQRRIGPLQGHLIAEAKKHAIDEDLDPPLRDIVIIAQ